MSIVLSGEIISNIFPNNKKPNEIANSLNLLLPKYEINTPLRVAAFIAQCGHESGEFTRFIENLNYSAEALCNTWPKRFPNIQSTAGYARNPEKIANFVYAGRLGNSGELSGDGWKYRGRGAIQITGKYNYTQLSKFLNKTLNDTVSYCETLDGAIESACYFWETKELNSLADIPDMKTITKKINGGTIGLESRIRYFEKALQEISE